MSPALAGRFLTTGLPGKFNDGLLSLEFLVLDERSALPVAVQW